MIILSAISQWWEALSATNQVFWFIAIIFSVLFFIQFILLLIGFDSDSADFDHSGDGGSFEHEFSALSVRSIIAFFTFFGWTGVLAMSNNFGVWLSVILAAIIGFAAMFIVAYLMFKFAQLEQSGTLNLYHALDQEGEVYLTIPAQKGGLGKVNLMIDGRNREMDAITEGESLKTGTPVKVIAILDENVLQVEARPQLQENNQTLLR